MLVLTGFTIYTNANQGWGIMVHKVLQTMLPRVTARIRRWPLPVRAAALLLGSQAVIGVIGLLVVLLTAPRLPALQQSPVTPLLLLFAIYMTGCAVVVVLAMRAFHHRLMRMGEQVNQEVAFSGLPIKVSGTEGDELDRLVTTLGALGQAYRESLATLAHRAEELATINLVAETVNQTFDLQSVIDTSLRQALRSINWRMGAIYMWDERAESLNMVSLVGLTEEMVRANFSFRLGESAVGEAAATHRMVISRRGPALDSPAEAGCQNCLIQICIPLLAVPGTLLGVLTAADREEKHLPADKLRILNTIAHQVALAIEKAQLYAEVSSHAENLEKVVAERTQQLGEAIEELWVTLKQAQEADRVKSLLLSTVSHELRTPLATIKGNTSLLQEHYGQMDPETMLQIFRDIEEETDKLTELISNLLEMSRIEAGILRIHPMPIDLADVLLGAVTAARIRNKAHPLHFDPPADLPLCFGDARRIEQIAANLLDNAAKYSPAGTPIVVSVRAHADELIVSVRDEGPGIAPEDQELIFDRFMQVHKKGDSARQGVGLGLAICRGLAEAHGGRIWVESKPGEGSTFSFSLPVATAEKMAEENQ
ncbi:MAG: hypothetical protein Kow00124_05250 [Anaerolineae bacterium]